MQLIDWAINNQIDYEKLRKRCTFKMQSGHGRGAIVDISVIIPVRGRTQFHQIVTEYFNEAKHNTKLSIALTFVEHAAPPPLHYWMTKSWVNHIFIPADGKPFNKCLCHNMGVLYGPKAHNYLFHDTDILVPGQFFDMLNENMRDKKAVQAFTQRRLIMAQETVTKQIIAGERMADFGPRSQHEYKLAIAGAPGGSICVDRKTLLDVGFYEDVFFTGYSVEDQFFFNKLKLNGGFGICDGPAIELIHLWHSSDHQTTTSQQELSALDSFDVLSDADKRLYMQSRKEYFLNYFK